MKDLSSLDLILQQTGRLPTLPGVAIRIIEAVRKDEPDLREISLILSNDPPLSAEVLRLINSAFYALPVRVTSVPHAVNLLGIRTIKNVALSFSVIKIFKTNFQQAFDYPLFWKKSLTAAVASKMIAERLKPDFAEDAFFLGLLHDIGTLALLKCMPSQYGMVLHRTAVEKIPLHEAEREALGFDHALAGEWLAKHWNLPDILSLPIGCHHNPEELVTADPSIGQAAMILHLADLFADLAAKENTTMTLGKIDRFVKQNAYEERIDVDSVAISIHEKTKEIVPLFDIKMETEEDYVNMIEQAREELIATSSDLVTTIIEQGHEIERLRETARRDGMTQLINHGRFHELLDQEAYRSQRYKTPLSLIMADIDGFKNVNDRYGHPAGDTVIQVVARSLRKGTRTSDHVARYGGDEFAIILTETGEREARKVLERLQEIIAGMHVVHRGNSITVTVSFGLASSMPGSAISKDDLIRQADDDLYRTKERFSSLIAG
ncbi:MAG: GGDEF domain-containing protein [Deltaproteobacteria bacterium]|nr:GGDEF domain-containing protein [Deltaproteobacteria bacterium]